ncbi:retrovirus-related pol polyprotein from transposon TNT 1-94 [Tanacetum coccineum]
MLPEWGRFVTAVQLNRGLKESNHDQLYAYLKKHESHANENKMLMERLNQHSHDPLALVSNVSPYQYPSSSSVPPQPSYTSPVTYQSLFTDNTQLVTGFSPSYELLDNLTKQVPILAQQYKTQFSLSNNQLRTSSNKRNQATVKNGGVMVQNVQGRQNMVQGNNARGIVVAGKGGLSTELEKMLLMQAQENGVDLDEEQPLFLAGGQTNTFDDEVDERPVQDMAQNEDNIFQVDQCDAFDSDVDEAPTAQTMFMANLSSSDLVYDEAGPSYDSNTISEVQDHDNCLDNMNESHEEHEMHHDNKDQVVHNVVSYVPNDAVMIITNDIYEQDALCVTSYMPNDTVTTSLTAELARYKELAEAYEKRAQFELTERELLIDTQMRMIIKDHNVKEESLQKELHSVNMKLNSTLNHNKLIREEVSTLKQDFKQKENKLLEEFLDMKHLKEKVKDKLYKQDQYLQIVHMFCKPKSFYDEINRVAIGYKNPFYLSKAKQVQPALYNGYEIVKTNQARPLVHDSEDTLEIAENNKKQMIEKMKDPECVKKKVKIAPHDYSKENYLATFTHQKQLTPEKIFWSDDLLKMKAKSAKPITAMMVYPPNTLAKLVPKVLPTKSQVQANIYSLVQLFLEFDKTCKKRITPTGLTEGEKGFEQTNTCYLTEVIPFFKTIKDHFKGIQKALVTEIKEMKEVFDQMEAEVDQHAVDKKCDEIKRKNLLIENENLIADCLSKYVFYTATNFVLNVSRFSNMHDAYTTAQKHIAELEAENSNLKNKIQNDDHDEMINNFPNLRELKAKISRLQKKHSEADPILDCKALDSQNKDLNAKVNALQDLNERFRVKNEKVKQHYKELYDSIKVTRAKTIEKTTSLLTEIETLKAQIKGKTKCVTMPDLVKPKVLAPDEFKQVKQVWEQLRKLLNDCWISVGALIRYTDLEVAFKKHSCYVRDTDGVELIKGSYGSNLYTISVEDMMKSSPICLLFKASKNKSWLWHRRLNHLNFGTINDLVRKDLVRGLPRLKFEKNHLCSACQLGKSKKHTHKPKIENTNLEVLNTFHMDLCRPMRVQTINGKKYILVIDDDYSSVGIFHQKLVTRTPQQNVIVKRVNCTLVEAARTMLIFSKAPMFLWAEAVATTCYTQNRSLIHTSHNKTPYELVHDRKPDLKFLRIFGAFCYLTNDSEDLEKLRPTTDIGIFVGYALNRKGYRIYNKRTRRIMETIHMQFDELTKLMAPMHISTGPAPILLSPGQISSGLVPDPIPAAPYVLPTNKDLEIFFHLMFDEYFEPPSVERPVSPAPAVQVLVVSAGTPLSTIIGQDAPSTSYSPSSSIVQPPISHQVIAAGPTIEDNPFA